MAYLYDKGRTGGSLTWTNPRLESRIENRRWNCYLNGYDGPFSRKITQPYLIPCKVVGGNPARLLAWLRYLHY